VRSHNVTMLKRPLEPMVVEQVNKILCRGNWQGNPTRIRQVLLSSLALAWLVVFNLPQTFAVTKQDQSNKPNFGGSWTLDLQASTSLEPLMNQIGASSLDRQYAAQTSLKATLQQTEDALKVSTRGPGFALDQTLYLDGRDDSGNPALLGATSVNAKTTWSSDFKQLVESHQIRTKQGKDGQLTIKRYLTDQGKTLVVAFNLKLNAETNQTSSRQIWRKQD
jgi:hypothetical protein